MKRRPRILLLLTIPIFGLFLWARNAASWRPKIITLQQLQAGAQTATAPIDWEEEALSLSPAQRQLKRRLATKDWFPRALSPDKTQVLADCLDCLNNQGVALVRASDAEMRHRLVAPKNTFQGEWRDARFSPDGRYVEFSQFESTPPQVFDAQTGKWLWSADYWNAKFAFSPDGTFAAHTNGNEDFIVVRDAATGRELKRLPYAHNEGALTFSRDSNSLLAEVAPDDFRKLRLR